jgi:hypothetical protein
MRQFAIEFRVNSSSLHLQQEQQKKKIQNEKIILLLIKGNMM